MPRTGCALGECAMNINPATEGKASYVNADETNELPPPYSRFPQGVADDTLTMATTYHLRSLSSPFLPPTLLSLSSSSSSFTSSSTSSSTSLPSVRGVYKRKKVGAPRVNGFAWWLKRRVSYRRQSAHGIPSRVRGAARRKKARQPDDGRDMARQSAVIK